MRGRESGSVRGQLGRGLGDRGLGADRSLGWCKSLECNKSLGLGRRLGVDIIRGGAGVWEGQEPGRIRDL